MTDYGNYLSASAPPAPSYDPPPASTEEARLLILKALAGSLEITSIEIVELRKLEGFKIVVLCDDSGSMNGVISNSDFQNPYSAQLTRWEDLKQNVDKVIKIAMALEHDGIDLYFLNRQGQKNVKRWEDIQHLFDNEPNGSTPLSKAVRTIISEKSIGEKKLLLVIATDGEPNDGYSGDSPAIFEGVLKNLDHEKIFISILACSDDKVDVQYLDRMDRKIPHLDVTDDFQTEKREVLKKGILKQFSRGDYVVKVLMGPVLPKWHNIDGKADAKGGCCTII